MALDQSFGATSHLLGLHIVFKLPSIYIAPQYKTVHCPALDGETNWDIDMGGVLWSLWLV